MAPPITGVGAPLVDVPSIVVVAIGVLVAVSVGELVGVEVGHGVRLGMAVALGICAGVGEENACAGWGVKVEGMVSTKAISGRLVAVASD